MNWKLMIHKMDVNDANLLNKNRELDFERVTLGDS